MCKYIKITSILFFVVLMPSLANAGESVVAPHMVWRMIDFAIFVGILYYLLRKPAASFFVNRKKQIFEEMQKAKKIEKQAELLLKEIEEKTSNMNERIKSIENTFKNMALKETEAMIQETEALLKKMDKSLEHSKALLLNKAKVNIFNMMRKEIIDDLILAFEGISKDEHSSINRKFIDNIGRLL